MCHQNLPLNKLLDIEVLAVTPHVTFVPALEAFDLVQVDRSLLPFVFGLMKSLSCELWGQFLWLFLPPLLNLSRRGCNCQMCLCLYKHSEGSFLSPKLLHHPGEVEILAT